MSVFISFLICTSAYMYVFMGFVMLQQVEKCNEVLEKLPAQTQATKEAILKYKKRDEQSCIDKVFIC